ncbi:hypothetical protein BGX33_007162 [Mortierella sp. NVP41]|nr:hypothetical protein BGX33_007162 [Mortierella sp. NVP41]
MFTDRQMNMIRVAGRTPIVWEEPLLWRKLSAIANHKDTVIQLWTSEKNIEAATSQGLRLAPEEAKLVLSGEVLLWGEQVDETNVDLKLWSRASAAAEVLWSSNSDDSPTKLWDGPEQSANSLRNVAALDRIHEHRFRMVSEKIPAEPLQPMWCVKNPGYCNKAGW